MNQAHIYREELIIREKLAGTILKVVRREYECCAARDRHGSTTGGNFFSEFFI